MRVGYTLGLALHTPDFFSKFGLMDYRGDKKYDVHITSVGQDLSEVSQVQNCLLFYRYAVKSRGVRT